MSDGAYPTHWQVWEYNDHMERAQMIQDIRDGRLWLPFARMPRPA